MTKLLLFTLLIALSALPVLLLQGCLNVEQKEYYFKINNDGSGECRIVYRNILSKDDDGKDVSFKDFGELVSDYLNGDKLEKEYGDIRDVKKRLFVEDGLLCGEMIFSFDSLSQAGLFQFDQDSPLMLYLEQSMFGSNEKYIESNGFYDKDVMPVIFWKRNSRELRLTTQVLEDTTGTRNLVKLYTLWKQSSDE